MIMTYQCPMQTHENQYWVRWDSWLGSYFCYMCGRPTPAGLVPEEIFNKDTRWVLNPTSTVAPTVGSGKLCTQTRK